MKKVLIIEDNALKQTRLEQVMSTLGSIKFTVCKTVMAAYPSLELEQWDLILLDMIFQVNHGLGVEIQKSGLAD